MKTTSVGGSRYFLTFVDDFTRKVFVFFIKDKSEVAEIFEEFRSRMERQTSKKIRTLRSDNGREYVNRAMDQNLRRLGIRHQKMIPYTPEQNRLANRMNRTIVERAKAMLFDAGLPKVYWAEAVATATYLINRSPAAGLKGKTPEEAWTGQRPDLKHLRVFGCKPYIHVPKSQRLKWDPKAEEMLFVDYCPDSKGYRLMDPKMHKIVHSRDVEFLDSKRKANTKPKETFQPIIESLEGSGAEDSIDEDSERSDESESTTGSSDEHFSETVEEEEAIKIESIAVVEPNTSLARTANEPLRRSTRVSKPVIRDDFITYYIIDESSNRSSGSAGSTKRT